MTPSRIDRMQEDVQVNQPGKLMAISLIAGLAIMFLGITTMTSQELTAGEAPAPAQAGATPGSDFVYFPGQYTSQAAEPSEHTEAF